MPPIDAGGTVFVLRADMLDATEPAQVHLDLTGLKCPLPALRTRKALREMTPGGRLAVIATDPLAAIDIPNVVREEGARVDRQTHEGGATHFLIRAAPV